MTQQKRIELIKHLGNSIGSKVITYVTSTRKGMETSMADDCIRIIYDHLTGITKSGKCEEITLFLYSNGGSGIVPWRLVNLLREHCNTLKIAVPYKAYSAATLTALGADKIIMHPMGELGPIDPTVANLFNPPEDAPLDQKKGISVEDVSSYVAFVKDELGITHQDELVQAFNILAQKIHPLALGNVKRFHSQSEMIAKKLLKKHMLKEEEHKMDEIVKILKSKFFFHGHPINRVEAREVGLKIECPSKKSERLMWKLYLEYEKELLLNTPFDPFIILNNKAIELVSQIDKLKKEKFELETKSRVDLKPEGITKIDDSIRIKNCEIQKVTDSISKLRIKTGLLKGAYIESEYGTDVFEAEGEILQPNPAQIRIEWIKTGWVKE